MRMGGSLAARAWRKAAAGEQGFCFCLGGVGGARALAAVRLPADRAPPDHVFLLIIFMSSLSAVYSAQSVARGYCVSLEASSYSL